VFKFTVMNQSMNFRGDLLVSDTALVMGVLNVTPDSFYSGSRILSEEALVRQAEGMLTAGAAILDLGGLSSRPGALEISEEEEKKRVLPAVEKLVRDFPGIRISVDSYRYAVARAALEAGAAMLTILVWREAVAWRNSRQNSGFLMCACICAAIRKPCRE